MKSESHSVMSDSLWTHRLYSPWMSPGQNTGAGSLSLLQEIFPIQGSNPGPSHCRQILYQLSHKENPRILEWVAYPFCTLPVTEASTVWYWIPAMALRTYWAVSAFQTQRKLQGLRDVKRLTQGPKWWGKDLKAFSLTPDSDHSALQPGCS